jgi:glycosyltransferase involved in cell wall biosynthesis
MRVLLTTDTIGGVWTFTKELTAELLRLEHQVALVSFGHAPSPEQQAWCAAIGARYGGGFRYEASTAPLEWMNPNESAYLEGELFLRNVADDFCPDLLHSNQFCFGQLTIRIPRLITAHSDVLSWGAACHPNGLEASSWLTHYRNMVERGLAEADAVVAPTQWMLDTLSQYYPLPAKKRVILNGRSLAIDGADGPRTLQAVSAGRLWDEAKNLAMLADVQTTIPILIAGDQQHQGKVAPEHIGAAVQVGPLSETDLVALFRASSMYLATSIYEPFGLAPLEAALCDCSILANDIPSLREVWGDAALYFNDAATLSSLLDHLQASPEILLNARQRSRRRALQLSAQQMGAQYLALYSGLLSLNKHVGESRPAEDHVVYAS